MSDRRRITNPNRILIKKYIKHTEQYVHSEVVTIIENDTDKYVNSTINNKNTIVQRTMMTHQDMLYNKIK